MKKKILKIIFILLLILVILLIVNLIRNYSIVKNIVDYTSSLNDDISNYYFKIEGEGDVEDEKFTSEYYYKDGILLIKTSFMDDESIVWRDFNTGEVETLTNDTDSEVSHSLVTEPYDDKLNIYNLALFSYNTRDVILNYIFKPITSENNCYKIVVKESDKINEYYINKDSKLIEKLTIKSEEGITKHTYEFKMDCVTDDDVRKPSLD